MKKELGFNNQQFAALMVPPENAEVSSVKVELGLDGSLSFVDDEGVHWTNIGSGWLSSEMISVMLNEEEFRKRRAAIQVRLIDKAVKRYREYVKKRLEAAEPEAQDDDNTDEAG